MTALLADSSASLKTPARDNIAARVKAQLAGDYPPSALTWISGVSWRGPQRVPTSQLDFKSGDWSSAADKRKVAAFAKRIRGGWCKPIVVIRRPGRRLLYLIDGHTRATACDQIGEPVTAYIGTAPADDGPWMQAHARQLSSDLPAIEMSAQTPYLAATPAPAGKPGGPGLWRVKGMQLPPYFQHIRDALERNGHSPEAAYRITWGAIRRWARGGGKVHPEVVAAAQQALTSLAAKSATAHAHASDAPAIELGAYVQGVWTEQLHPRGFHGKFASKGGQPATSARTRHAAMAAAAPEPPEPPGEMSQIQALKYQASQDRQLARQILAKVAVLQRKRAAAVAGVPGTSPVNPAKSAAAKKAAATRAKNKAAGITPKKAKATVPGASKAKTVAKLTGQIRLLRRDAGALLQAANHLDAQAARL